MVRVCVRTTQSYIHAPWFPDRTGFPGSSLHPRPGKERVEAGESNTPFPNPDLGGALARPRVGSQVYVCKATVGGGGGSGH